MLVSLNLASNSLVPRSVSMASKPSPTELYFVWAALDDLSYAISGKKVFEARDFAKDVPCIMFGYGAYLSNGKNVEPTKPFALNGFNRIKPKNRFVYSTGLNLYNMNGPAVLNQEMSVAVVFHSIGNEAKKNDLVMNAYCTQVTQSKGNLNMLYQWVTRMLE